MFMETKYKTQLNCALIVQCSILLVVVGAGLPSLYGCQDNTTVLEKSEELLNAGTPQAAVEGLETFIETAPEDPKARMLLGKVYNDLGRYTDAVMELQKASQLYAAQPEKRIAARIELARTYLRFGDRHSPPSACSDSFNAALWIPKSYAKSSNSLETVIIQSS